MQDCPHDAKGKRNNLLSGTRCTILGRHVITFTTIVELLDLASENVKVLEQNGLPPVHFIKTRDVFNMDKQDDGAARRFFHSETLGLVTQQEESGRLKIRESMGGLFVFNFVCGMYTLRSDSGVLGVHCSDHPCLPR